MSTLIDVQSVSKAYKIYSKAADRALEWFSLGVIQRHRLNWAVRDVSLELRAGEIVGLIGPNGAGKSTLLKMIAQTVRPTRGTIERRGRVGALLELGAGFHPDLSGLDNVSLNARMLGFSHRELEQKLPAILDFAGIGEAVGRPVRTYSTGMFVRLAFSVVAMMEPDVLLVDEAISVGDVEFQRKCLERIAELRRQGVGILFVSHDLYRVENLADRALCLIDGKIAFQGEPFQVIRDYKGLFEKEAVLAPEIPLHFEKSPVQIVSLQSGAQQRQIAIRQGLPLELAVRYQVREPVEDGLVLRVVFALPEDLRVGIIGVRSEPGPETPAGEYLTTFSVGTEALFPRKYVLHLSLTSARGVTYDVRMHMAELTVGAHRNRPEHIRAEDQLVATIPFQVTASGVPLSGRQEKIAGV